jgi:hypothetical protein
MIFDLCESPENFPDGDFLVSHVGAQKSMQVFQGVICIAGGNKIAWRSIGPDYNAKQ